MLKKSLSTAGIAILVTLVLFMIYGIVEKIIANKSMVDKIQSLNVGPLFKMDSTHYKANPSTPTVLIYFNSTCEHCQYELAEIKKNTSLFENISIVLMSFENIDLIKKVGDDFEMGRTPNIEFVKINRDDVFETYGSLATPHIFIYAKDQKLIKEFKGETKIDAIVKHLP